MQPRRGQFYVYSSHANFIVDHATGNVIECELVMGGSSPRFYRTIVRFDLASYFAKPGVSKKDDIDFIHVGFWTKHSKKRHPPMFLRNAGTLRQGNG